MARFLAQIWAKIVSFSMVLFTFICSLRYLVTKKFADSLSGSSLKAIVLTTEPMTTEEFSSPSIFGFPGGEGLSALAKKICELEGKINMLLAKSCAMPEREELFNAAVCRVDALEAELISTKKVRKLCSAFIIVISLYV